MVTASPCNPCAPGSVPAVGAIVAQTTTVEPAPIADITDIAQSDTVVNETANISSPGELQPMPPIEPVNPPPPIDPPPDIDPETLIAVPTPEDESSTSVLPDADAGDDTGADSAFWRGWDFDGIAPPPFVATARMVEWPKCGLEIPTLGRDGAFTTAAVIH